MPTNEPGAGADPEPSRPLRRSSSGDRRNVLWPLRAAAGSPPRPLLPRREDAAEAAAATADAAKAALASMALAETSAAKTAAASKIVVLSTRADLADAESDEAMSEINEVDAQAQYRAATDRAEERR